ncbi:MAG: transposase [Holosporaceae bacterium]|jgi:transposase-like protein|nr:transposase [Holosporaceae bacterium]
MKKKLSKEEKEAKQELRSTLRALLGDGHDLKAINDLVVELKKEAIEMMYDEELKTHLGFSKNGERPENSDNYRNGSYEKKVKICSDFSGWNSV